MHFRFGGHIVLGAKAVSLLFYSLAILAASHQHREVDGALFNFVSELTGNKHPPLVQCRSSAEPISESPGIVKLTYR